MSSFMKFSSLIANLALSSKKLSDAKLLKTDRREEASEKTSNPLTAPLPEKMFSKTESETLVL